MKPFLRGAVPSAKAIDPQLRHFLQRRSYSKALERLEAIDADVTHSRVVEREVLDQLDEPASQ